MSTSGYLAQFKKFQRIHVTGVAASESDNMVVEIVIRDVQSVKVESWCGM